MFLIKEAVNQSCLKKLSPKCNEYNEFTVANQQSYKKLNFPLRFFNNPACDTMYSWHYQQFKQIAKLNLNIEFGRMLSSTIFTSMEKSWNHLRNSMPLKAGKKSSYHVLWSLFEKRDKNRPLIFFILSHFSLGN